MESKVLIADDDVSLVDGLISLLLLEDLASAGACDRMSAQAMISGTFYPVAEVERQVAIGEDAAIEQLHGDVRKLLFSIANGKYRFDAAEAEDIVQDAWLLYLEKGSGIRNASAWLAGTVSNLCRKRIGSSIRARETFVHVDAIDRLADSKAPDPDRAVALNQALASLSDATRNMCELIAMEGRAYGEVSLLTGLPLGSVGPLYLRAKKKMKIVTSLGGAC